MSLSSSSIRASIVQVSFLKEDLFIVVVSILTIIWKDVSLFVSIAHPGKVGNRSSVERLVMLSCP